MKIVEMGIDSIIPYDNNPRINAKAVEKVRESIRQFGFRVPIIVDKNKVIVAGHTRREAAKLEGLYTVPVIFAEDMTEEQIKAFRLVDNKTNEYAEWDFDRLERELREISDIDMEMWDFEFVEDEYEDEDEDDSPYSEKTNVPQYEITGDVPALPELVDEAKTKELIDEIDNSELSYEEKRFLKMAAQRHLVFNYKKVAEYYAAASPEMQDLMEKSALVIIDYNDAIMNGYTKLSDKIKKMIEADENAG